MVAAWRRAWDRVIPFFAFPPQIRRVIYTANAIESINARLRKIIKTRGHFPSDDAASKPIWLAPRNITADWGARSQGLEGGNEPVRDTLRRSLHAAGARRSQGRRLNHDYMAQPGCLRRPGRGLKTEERSVESKSTNLLELKNSDSPPRSVAWRTRGVSSSTCMLPTRARSLNSRGSNSPASTRSSARSRNWMRGNAPRYDKSRASRYWMPCSIGCCCNARRYRTVQRPPKHWTTACGVGPRSCASSMTGSCPWTTTASRTRSGRLPSAGTSGYSRAACARDSLPA